MPESPLDLVVLSDLAPHAMKPHPPRLRRMDKEELADYFKELSPSCPVAATWSQSPGPTVVVPFEDIRALRPEGIALKSPAAAELMRLRGLIDGLKKGIIPLSMVKEQLKELKGPPELVLAAQEALSGGADPDPATTPSPGDDARQAPPMPGLPRPSGDPLENLLNMVDIDAPPADPESSAASRGLDRIIRELIGVARSSGNPSSKVMDRLLSDIDDAIGSVLRGILHSSPFQALESSWLGLRFLVRRIDFRSGVRLHVVATPRSDLESALQKTVFPFTDGQREEGRTPVVILDYDFGADDLPTLRKLTEMAAERRVPVITSMTPSILGMRSIEEIHDSAEPTENLPEPEWSQFRETDDSRWLTTAMNRFLLRLPYGPEGDRVKGFTFEENPPEGDPAYLWGRPGWILGVLVTGSFATTGWGTMLTGPGGAVVDDLPVHLTKRRAGDLIQCPLETLLSEQQLLLLSLSGFTTLATGRQSDQIFLITVPTLYKSDHTTASKERHRDARQATLPYQLMLAQITALVDHLYRWIDRRSAAEEIGRTLAKGLQFLIEGPGEPFVEISSGVLRDDPGGSESVALRIIPVGGPLRGLPDIYMEMSITR
ncbi:MAG: type VI secretion system contractile sheath large subunit [Candidatus Eisenbacteria bacterium]|nr:type VI secretion system contractile sheath large subunit [Candidatus Eisenbacteria bacterium]